MSEPPIAKVEDLLAIRDTFYPELRGCLDSLQEAVTRVEQSRPDKRPQIVVLGRFSSGKSHFLNALLGANVLPVDAAPLTAHRAYLKWGAQVEYRQVFRSKDGTIKARRVPKEALASVEQLRESGYPVGRKDVPVYVVTAPAQILRRVVLVDTPGYDDPQSRTWQEWAINVTLKACSSAHAILVVLGQTAGQIDLDAVARCLEQCGRVIVVLNKSDLRDRDANLEMAYDTSESFSRVLGYKPRVYIVSSLWESCDPAQRREMLDAPPLCYFGEPPTHEWHSLLRRIQEDAALVHQSRLADKLEAICQVYRALCRFSECYDRKAQAEHYVRTHFAELKAEVADPLGLMEDVRLGLEVHDRVRWRLLERVGITPETIAPPIDFDAPEWSQLCSDVRTRYEETAQQLLHEHGRDLSVGVFALLRREIDTLFADREISASLRESVLEASEWLTFRQQTATLSATYQEILSSLRSRWARCPNLIAADSRWITDRLTASLESLEGAVAEREP